MKGLMGMPVMDVGPVYVRMGHRLVDVKVLMLLIALGTFMLMLVMFVMDVWMSVGESFVLMAVSVCLAVEEEHTRKHDQCRQPVSTRRTLTQHDDGKEGAYEGAGCEPRAGSCRPYLPQGANE